MKFYSKILVYSIFDKYKLILIVDVTKNKIHIQQKYKETLEIIIVYLATCVPYIIRVIEKGILLYCIIDKPMKITQHRHLLKSNSSN